MTASMFSLAHKVRSKIADFAALRKTPKKTLDDLDDALLAHILARLPVDSLCRCRAVSRRWCNLIYSRRVLHPRRVSGVFLSRDAPRRSRFLNFDGDASYDLSPGFLRGALVLASSGGLLLCGRAGDDGLVGELFVCDPASSRAVSLPVPKRGPLPDPSDDMCLGLAVEPSPRAAGPLDGLPNFKVVSVHLVGGSDASNKCAAWTRYGFEIFSSEHGEWRPLKKISADVAVKRGTQHEGGVFLNGALHWLGRLDGECHILALDLRQVTARKMQVPAARSKDGAVGWFGESDGSLHVATTAGSHLEVWRMHDYLNVEWARICDSPISDAVSVARTAVCVGRPVGLNGNRVLQMTSGNQIVAYDMECRKWDPIGSTKEDEEIRLGIVDAVADRQQVVPYMLTPARWPHRNDDWVVVPVEDFSTDEEVLL